MNEIILPDFKLEKFDLTKKEHLELVKTFDSDSLVKQYLYPYKDSFYDLVNSGIDSQNIFHSFYVIYHEDMVIGYVEIETPKKTFVNYAIVKQHRRKGYASMFLKQLATYLLTNYKNEVESVNTIIRKTNEASINASLKSGFVPSDEKDINFETFTKRR